ncbi:hypothetical protein D3C73_1291380 [compost metagenome]
MQRLRAVGRGERQAVQRQLLMLIQQRVNADVGTLILQALAFCGGVYLQFTGIELPRQHREILNGDIQQRQLFLQLVKRQGGAIGITGRQF